MKKSIILILTLCMMLSLLILGVSAQKNHVQVTVTIAVKGELVAAQVSVQIEDVDGDGIFTVNDALYCAHAQYYQGGAEAGYGYYSGEYGLSMSKLWGDESGAYGYYLNDASCMSLADPIKDGDYVTAFVYKNADWSDVYTYFDVAQTSVELGQAFTLTLMAAGYDENWNPITYPVAGASITVDGSEMLVTSSEGVTPMFVTDENGQVEMVFNTMRAGDPLTRLISAKCKDMTVVPPVCQVSLTVPQDTDEQTDPEQSGNGCDAIVGTTLIALLPLAYLCIKRKEH